MQCENRARRAIVPLLMDGDAIRAFAHRDWTLLEQLDREHWVETYRRGGGMIGFQVAAGMAEYVRRTRPEWPTAAERQRDLEDHIELKRRIDRAAGAFPSR